VNSSAPAPKLFITGDATPDYHYFPATASRLRRLAPRTKIIFLVRDPILHSCSTFRYHQQQRDLRKQRQYGQQQQQQQHGNRSSVSVDSVDLAGHTLAHWTAIFAEEIDRCLQRQQQHPDLHPPSACFFPPFASHLNFFGRAAYQRQIDVWLEYFPPQQLLVISAERFFNQPREALDRVGKFLGLSTHDYTDQLLRRKWNGPNDEQRANYGEHGDVDARLGEHDDCISNPPSQLIQGLARFNLSYSHFLRRATGTGVLHFL
jgi:hypothetical protein